MDASCVVPTTQRMTEITMSTRFAILLLAGALSAACSQAEAPAAQSEPAVPGASAPAPAAPKTVADLFPAGPERDLVLNNCASCHNVACATIGQRPAARWDDLEQGHSDRVPGADLDAIFAYLKGNFDDTKPAPNVPPEFLEGGCTPF